MKRGKMSTALLCITLSALLLLAGCQGGGTVSEPPVSNAPTSTEPVEQTPELNDLNVAVVVFGTFGDNGFNDLAKSGLERAITELGVKGKTFESGGYDITKIEPLLLDLCEADEYDVIMVMGAACREPAENASALFPDQKFVIFDAEAMYSEKSLENVASVTFRQNEASFLGGVIAGYVTTSDMELANSDKTVGVVLLRDNAVINDFLVGYIEGCRYIDEEIKILSAYNNSAADSAKAKELAMNMASQGADVIFGVCSLATLGVVDGCKEKNVYAIGVDNDVALQVKSSDEATAALVLSSVLKNTDVAVFRAIEAMQKDINGVKWGEVESVGFQENCVGLARNEYFDALPQELRDMLDKCEADIISGALKVGTAFGMSTEDVATLRDNAAK